MSHTKEHKFYVREPRSQTVDETWAWVPSDGLRTVKWSSALGSLKKTLNSYWYVRTTVPKLLHVLGSEQKSW